MPTWRDTNPVPGADAPRRKRKARPTVTPEPTRGGVSAQTQHRKPLPWVVCFMIAACIMAFAAGREHKAEQAWHYVDKNRADQRLCNYSPNGPVTNVTVYDTDPYTWYVHCANGITMSQSAPVNP